MKLPAARVSVEPTSKAGSCGATNGAWAEMGAGAIDFATIVADLRKTGYAGWIMVEDESPRAESDPNLVTLKNGKYVSKKLDVQGV